MNVDWLEIVGPSLFFFHFSWHKLPSGDTKVTGSSIGTCSSIPSQTSLPSPAFTSSFQWMGTGTGEWCAESSVFGSIINVIGGPSIMGSSWCAHILKMGLGTFWALKICDAAAIVVTHTSHLQLL